MINKVEGDFWENLAVKMQNYSDEEVLEVLRKLNHYEPQAAKLAIAEGIKRGLINSEQDLLSEEFRAKSLHFTLFPMPDKKTAILKIIRSISRSILLVGLIPLIFGIMKLRTGNVAVNVGIILTGVLWFFSAWSIFERQDRRFWMPLIVIAFLATLYAIRIMTGLKGLRTMDYVVAAILFSIIFYCLFYLRQLLRRFGQKKSQNVVR